MHLLYCDETNLEERAGDFLIYGGLVIEAEEALSLSHDIDRLLKRNRISPDYRLKFNPAPKDMAHEEFIALKRELIKLAHERGARLLAYAILHDIATNPDEARRNGINTVCFHFHCVLNRTQSPGLVLIDRFNDNANAIDTHLRDKFTVGIKGLPFKRVLRLENIIGFHYSAIGQSHMPSIIDVALGSLRFAFNAYTRQNQNHMETAVNILELLSPLFWREAGDAADAAVPEIGLTLSPQVVKAVSYRQRYEGLKAFLAEGGIRIAQPITGDHRY